MAQQFKVLVNAGKDQAPQTLQAEQGAGQRGRPLIIKAKAGAKYQLVEQGKGRGNDLAPDNIKAKRVGKHLHLMFETDTVADVIIEDYYDVMPEGYNGVIGKAENGSFYEYLTEDPTDPGLIPELKDNVTAVTQALGGAEVSPAGAAVAFAAFPLLGALGLLGGAAAVAAAANNNGTTTTTGTTTGKLDPTAPNDSGVIGDNITNDNTPTLSGTVPTGSTATVTINGQTYPVTVAADGTWKFTNPTNLPDGTYYPVLNVTTNGVTTPTNLTPFTIDTVTTVNIGNPGKVGATDPISGTAEPGDTVVVKDANGQVIGSATANSAGVWSLTPSAPVPAGVITATATDAAGNTATDTDTPVSGNASLKTALTIDPIAADNVLLANESGATSYLVTGKVTGTFAAGDVVFLSLNGKTYPAIVSADGTYSTLVSMADLKADPDTKIEGSITPTGGDPATAAQDYTVESGNVPTQTALSIDPVTADNIIGSTEGTGNIAITGKVTGKFSAGDTVTLTVNNKTFTGQAAADGSYSIAVPAADLKADADTQVDGTVTGTGGTLAKAIQDYGVDANVNPAPPASLKTALTIDPIAADNVLLANESGATTYTVTGKVTGAFAAGDVVFLSLNGKTYPAIVNADGTYSTLVSMADLKADPDTKIEGTITPTGGDIATAAQDYTVEAGNVATQTALSIDPVTADNIIGSSESSGSITLTGKVTGKFSAGDVVKLTVAGVTYSGTAAADGSYSIPVPAASLLADSDTQVDGTVIGTGGTLAKAVQDYGIAPSINPNGNSTGALTPTAPNDSGVVGDNTTNDNTPSLSGKVPTGSSATVTINGQTYPVTVNPDGTWSFTQPTNLPDGTYYPVLNVTTGGVTTPTNITPFTIDTTPPTVAVTSNAAALAAGETATITFTLSEKSTDFTADDIAVTGGTLSNFQQSATDPKVYTATFTPSSTGTGTSATVSVASDKFADAAANRNTDGAEANNTVSFKTNATVTGALTATAPNDSGVVGDNTTNDTTPTLNGKVPSGSTATVTLNGQTYPVTVNPDGTWSFTNPTNLPDGTYTPQLNVTTNGVTTTTPITPFTIDTTPPTVIVTSGSSSLASGQTANITFTLSEVVSDFSNGDITVAGGTLSNLVQSATDPKVYTAVFTPTSTSANALATIGVASDKFSDAAANFNKDTLISPAPAGATYEANNSVTLTTNATVSGQLSGASDNSTGTPNDHKTNDATPELTGKVPAGSTATVTINGQTYPVTVAPDGSWTFTQPTNLPDGTYTPVLNVTTNGVTTPTNITPFTIDTTPPTVIVSGTTNTLAAGQSTTLTFTLSEASNDLSGGDFVVAGGTLSALQQSATDPKVYTATFTATPGTTTASTATVSIASDKFADAAGNLNKDGADANNLWTSSITPATAPQPPASLKTALTIDPITGDNVVTLAESGATTYTVTGKVTGTFAAGDLVTLRLNDKPFYATVLADGSYSTVVPMADLKADSDTKIEGTVTGTGGSVATAAQDYTVEATNTVTQTALSINAVTADNIIGSTESTGNITLTGKVTGKFVAGDIVTLTVKGINYSGTAAADGSYSIPVPAAGLIADTDTQVDGTVTGTGGTVAKAVQDYGVDPNINPGLVDKTPPTIVVARTNSATTTLDANGKETLVFTLSEASTTFDANDIVVFGGSGTITGFAAVPTSGTAATGYTQYTAVFTPTAGSNGTANIGVASGKFADNAGNLNQDTYLSPAPTGATTEVNNSVSVAYDTRNTNTVDNDKPNIQVSIDKTTLASGQTGTLSFILSEASTDFTLSDITVISGGGTVTNLQAVPGSNGTQYTATYTAGANAGNVLIGVAETTFSDAAGNFNADTYKGSATGTSAVSGGTAETNNWVQLTTTGSVDSAPPTVIVSRTGTGNVGTAGEAIVFTFSEGVATSSFTLSDIDATNGSMSNLVPVESSKTATGVYTQYTATYTPTTGSMGTGSIGVAAGKFADTAGNNNLDTYNATADSVTGHIVETNNQVVLPIDATNSVDTTPPKIAISADKTTLAAGQTATITFTLSEASADFVQSDVTTTGGSLSNWTRVNATTYTATYTATAGGQSTGSVHVASNAFSDAAVNYNQDGAEANNTVDFITNNGTDLTPPKIAISSNQASLTTGQTATITFTVSEATSDFSWDGSTGDIAVTGGTLGALTHVGVNAAGEDVYTAVFTPAANSTTPATIAVAAGKFRDASGNQNLDTYNATADTVAGHIVETNNIVTLTVNTSTVAAALNLTSDKATALEAGGAYSATGGATAGTNPAMAAASGVLSNDTGTSPTVTGIQKLTDTTATAVAAGTTSSSGTTIVGQYGTLYMGADGSYVYTVDNGNATVQGLRTTANTVTDVFTYTASDASGTKTANLVVTVQGANDAPVAVADTATAVEAGGTGNATAGTTPTGNVLSNDTDVDLGDTKTVSAIHTGSATGTGGDVAVTAATAAAATGITGAHGTLKIGTDGSYSYSITQADTAVEALLPTSTPLTDTFTYTVKDATGATSQQTITVNITGANDKPTVTTPIADTTGTVGTALTPINVTSSFADVDTAANGETATYSAKLVDSTGNLVNGGNLPSWLQIDAATGIVTGTPPAGTAVGDIYVRAIRTDAGGLSASDDFKIALAAAADTTPPTIAVTRTNVGTTLGAGATETITFTLSEAATNFSEADIAYTGGTLSNFTAMPSSGTPGTGYTVYTATFTPTAGSSGTATVGVAAGKFTDNAGNLNQDTYVSGTGYEANNQVSLNYNTVPADTTPPKIALTRTGTGDLSQGGTDTITFVLSEASTTFSRDDVDVTGGTLSNFAPVTTSGTAAGGYHEYTATFTPTPNSLGTAAIGVASSKFTDVAGNANLDTYLTGVAGTSLEANNLININYNTQLPDTTAPTVIVSRAAAGMVTATETIYFTLSEASTNFVLGDIDYTGGALSNFAPVASSGNATSGYTQYSATFTPTANAQGTATIGVVSAKFTDAAGNTNADTYVNPAATGTTYETNNIVALSYNTLVPDTTAPTVAVSRAGAGVATGAETITFTLSEASNNFVLGDIDYTGGTLANLQPVLTSGSVSTGYTQYTATFTPTAGVLGTATIGVLSGKFTDAASNLNQDTYLSGVTGAVQEVNNQVSFAFNTDVTPPTIAIARTSSGTVGSAGETITFTLSEAATDFTLADIAVTGGSIANLQSVPGSNGAQYTATFTPTAGTSGSATIGVLSAKFSDAAGNFNKDTFTNPATGTDVYEINNQISLPFNTDTTAPTIVVGRIGTGNLVGTSATDTITFTLSEASTDFALTDIDYTGGTLANLVPVTSSGNATTGYTQYTATFTPTAGTTGTATIGVVGSKFSDAAGNQNKDTFTNPAPAGQTYEANNQVNFSFDTTVADTTAPTVTVTRSAAGMVNGTEVINFTLSESSTSFDISDITYTGGTIGSFTGSGTSYSVVFTPTANSVGTGTVGVLAGKFSDAAANLNKDTYTNPATGTDVYEANNQVSLPYNTDTTPPTVIVARTASGTVGSAGEDITFTLSEASSNFTLADIAVTGGNMGSTLTQSSTNPLVYTAHFTPDPNGVGTATVGVQSHKFTDAAGNDNLDDYRSGVAGTVQEGNNQVVFQYSTDTTPPTITVSTPTTTLGSGQTATITFTLSELSSNFAWDPTAQTGDITVTGGTLGALTQSSTDPKVYTATFTPTAGGSGSATIGVLSGKFSDAAGNNNKDTYTNPATGTDVYEANNQVSLGYNTLGNSVATIDIVSASIDSGASTSDFITNDQTLTYAGTITGWVPGLGDRVMLEFTDANTGQVTTAYVTPGATGAWSWTDASRNAGTHSIKATIVSATGNVAINTTAPTSLSGNLTQGGYDVQAVVIDTSAGSPTDINLAVSITTDADNNTYVNKAELGASTTFTSKATFDTALAKPGMVITLSDGISTPVAITLTAADVANGYVTTTFAKPAEGAVQTVTAKLTDLAGNVGTQTVSDSATLDTTPISVIVSRASTTNATLGAGGSEVITFTLSEASSNFTWDGTTGDITVTGGTLGALTQSSTDPKVYTATFTPAATSTGTATIGVLDGKFSDAAGNNNLDTYLSTAPAPAVVETNNQVSLAYDTLPPTQTVSFSSMTKDSGVTTTSTINSNWLTNDTSAGRLVSGFLSAPLAAGEVVNVYSNGTLIGTATVAAGGTTWEITDLNGYTGSWAYTAKVADAAGNTGDLATQAVTTDLAEGAPVITGVFDSVNTATTIANNGTTTNTLSTVSGTAGIASAGNTIYLYDNNYTTLVGSAVVDTNGNWSVTSLTGTVAGINTFAAKQVDAQGNHSVMSNLWSVGTNQFGDGGFTSGALPAGFTTSLTYAGAGVSPIQIYDTNVYNVLPVGSSLLSQSMGGTGNGPATTVTTGAATAPVSYGSGLGTWTKKSIGGNAAGPVGNPDGTITGNEFVGQVSTPPPGGVSSDLFKILSTTMSVVAGQTYQLKFDYITGMTTENMSVTIDGVKILFTSGTYFESGHFTATYTAPTTKNIEVFWGGKNPTGNGNGDFVLDNLSFVPANAGSAAAFIDGPTANPDTLSYTAGALDALGSNDVITATATNLQTKLAAGGNINGGAGMDTLKLAPGTTLNLKTDTAVQTVKHIEQVEVFELQGGSSLTLTANDVLSLGGANDTTMSAYSFASSTGGASSTGKVQFVVNATSTDTVTLGKLAADGITTNGVVGNTGLDGAWSDMGTTTIGSVTYKVYNHSTTDAQVLVSNATVSLPATLAPVVIDLNQDGVMGYSQIQMDLNADGVLDSTAWVGAQDGVLVRDSFGDGSVRSTSQFAFARNTGETDLQGLAAQFDSNHDGVLDAKDAQFGEFAVWQDANQNGVADAGEVKHLSDLGITSIKLASDAVVRAPATGVTEAGQTTATAADGSAVLVADAAFDYTLGTASATVQAGAAKSADAAALMQNKPYTLSPEQIAQFQAVVDAATAAAGDNAVDVTINELAPTGLEPLVFQHVLPTTVDANGAALVQPTHCEPSVILPGTSTDAAATADQVVDVVINELAPTGLEPLVFQHVVVDQQQPTHCDEPWLIQLNGPTGTEPVVFNLNPAAWNKPFELSAEQMSELGLPVPADSNLASQFKLNVSDVLLTPADANAKPALQLNGQEVTADTLNLSTLLSPAGAPAHLTGTAQIEGQAFNFAVDATLQAMIDHQQHHATVS